MPKKLILICGKAASGKSSSIQFIDEPEKVLYINTEGKPLPIAKSIQSKFTTVMLADPLELIGSNGYLAQCRDEGCPFKYIIIDSLTFLMDKYETMHVLTSNDTRTAWGNYAQFFKRLMNELETVPQNVILTAHTNDVLNEKELVMETKIKVKGSLMDRGIEAYFTDIIYAKVMPTSKLQDYANPLLDLDPDSDVNQWEAEGSKHVFQTRQTKDTLNERIRCGMGCWNRKETFIDANILHVINRYNNFYGE